MWAYYLFFLSLFGIIVLLSLKVWELKRGAKPFSVLRYRLDLFSRRKMEDFRSYGKYLNTRTVRLVLAFVVAKTSGYASILLDRLRESYFYKTIKGKVNLGDGNGPVSAFLRDVAEFKNSAIQGGDKKETEQKEKGNKPEKK